MKMLVAALVALALTAASARAEEPGVPLVLSHQGRLLDARDAPVRTTTRLTFQLHDNDNANLKNPLWSEEHDVQFQDGNYAVLLGDTRPGRGGSALPSTLLAKPELYLSVTVDGAELQPRMRISSAPYALRAGRALAAETVVAGGVDTQALKDGSVTLAKLALTNGKFAGLDADTLDGLDASAFAPASIEGKVDAIHTSIGDGLAAELGAVKTTALDTNTKVGTLGTELGAVKTTALDTNSKVISIGAAMGTAPANGSMFGELASLKGSAADITARLGTPPGGSSLAGEIATLRTVAARKYSRTCRNSIDNWVITTYGDEASCLRDGRWHEVFTTKNNAPSFGSVADVRAAVDAGASLKVTVDENGTSWPKSIECEVVSLADGDIDAVHCGANRRDDAPGATGMEWITYDTKTNKSSAATVAMTGPTNWTFRWWARF